MKAFRKLLLSDIKQFFRDRVAVFFAFAFPILFMLIFGFVFNNNSVSYRIGLANEDNSATSTSISQSLQTIPELKISIGSLDNELADFRAGKLDAVLELPQGLGTALANGSSSAVKLYYDPTQTTTSQMGQYSPSAPHSTAHSPVGSDPEDRLTSQCMTVIPSNCVDSSVRV